MDKKPIDKRKLTIALVLLLVVLAAAFGLSLTSMEGDTGKTAEERAEPKQEAIEDACASRATFQGLKLLLFDQAGRTLTGDRVNFDILAANAVVRMDNPVVESRDEELRLTRCTGNLILELPPGAERGFEGERRLTADVTYEVQAAADGSGPVYRLGGADAMIARLAAFDMAGQRLQAPEPALPDDPFANMAEPSPFPVPEPAPQPEPPPPPPPRESDSNPSFDCDDARTRGEIMVCGSGRLGSLDRRMADMYEDAMDDAGRRTRNRLVRTRDNFLAYRDRCRDEACIAQAYDGRMREIRDIVAAGD